MGKNSKIDTITSINQNSEFQHLIKKKNLFRLSIAVCLLSFYLGVPLLVMKNIFPFKENFIAPAWIYTFSLFFITWLLGYIYWRHAKVFEQNIQDLLEKKER